jgi:hypothetical protein
MRNLSLRAKRLAKSMAVGIALSGGHPPDSLTRSMLRMMRIGYSPPSAEQVYRGGADSAACVSIDFDATVPERLNPNAVGTAMVLELAERYGVPMTWAVCGRTAEEDRQSYESILGSAVGHEIGVHTYSHADASIVSGSELGAEIERCVGVLALPNRPKTFIFPWNRVAHLEVVRKSGFIAYRDKQRVIGFPRRVEGVWNIPPVWYLDSKAMGATGLIKRVIDLSISSRCVFHVWFHPWSVVSPTPEKFSKEVLSPILSYLNEKREEGRLAIETLGSLAGWLEGGVEAS